MHSRTHASKLVSAIALTVLAPGFADAATATNSCSIQSAPSVAPVVELYTSEGCSSCPPADTWLSKLKLDSGIVALGFHVDYWDRLGWKDRFGSSTFAQRQEHERAHNGATFGYTPQVVMDGLDSKNWYRSVPPSSERDRPLATVNVVLERIGDSYSAVVTPMKGAPEHLEAFWAVTEDGHRSNVKGGENKGVMLNHDFVVREYLQVKAWSSVTINPARLQFTPTGTDDATHPRHINLIVRNAKNGRPVQAVKLGC
jgi:hypothetical protein